MSLLVYTKTGCGWCDQLIDFLKVKNVSFEEKNVSRNKVYFEEMVNISGQTFAPTVIVDGVVYPDTDREEIKKILKL